MSIAVVYRYGISYRMVLILSMTLFTLVLVKQVGLVLSFVSLMPVSLFIITRLFRNTNLLKYRKTKKAILWISFLLLASIAISLIFERSYFLCRQSIQTAKFNFILEKKNPENCGIAVNSTNVAPTPSGAAPPRMRYV